MLNFEIPVTVYIKLGENVSAKVVLMLSIFRIAENVMKKVIKKAI